MVIYLYPYLCMFCVYLCASVRSIWTAKENKGEKTRENIIYSPPQKAVIPSFKMVQPNTIRNGSSIRESNHPYTQAFSIKRTDTDHVLSDMAPVTASSTNAMIFRILIRSTQGKNEAI